MAWSARLLSRRSSGTSFASHTSSNGSLRVRQRRGDFACDGSGPRSHSRAVRTLMPAAAAAASCVLPSMRFCLNNRT